MVPGPVPRSVSSGRLGFHHTIYFYCVLGREGGRERGEAREREREVEGGGKKVGEGVVERHNVKVFVVARCPSLVVVFVFTARETRYQ